MAGFKTDNDSGLIGEINVTPFVDVVLVLLIIFMSTSTVIIRTALDLDIPVASNAETMDETAIHSILLEEDNTLELNGEPSDEKTLIRYLKRAVAESKRRRKNGKSEPVQALISAGGDHDYQDVVHLIDVVKGTGVGAIALNTRAPKTEGYAADETENR